MKGDFSRIAFDPANHFSSVLLQQGRVTLDADPNEQAAILLHYLRTLARDLIGPYGGPSDALGFELTLDTSGKTPQLLLGSGRYYVEGILCESEGCNYAQQPDCMPAPVGKAGEGDVLLTLLAAKDAGACWVYLDVWERLITHLEDDRIREVALGGPDTSARSKVIWQVKSVTLVQVQTVLEARLEALEKQLEKDPDNTELIQQQNELKADLEQLKNPNADVTALCQVPLQTLESLSSAALAARLDPGPQINDPCVLPVDAAYRGTENHLYRVEVHRGSAPGVQPTFKWSRDNGSTAARWLATEGDNLVVSSIRDFSAGDWVELSHDQLDLTGAPGALVRLVKVQNGRLSVDPQSLPPGATLALDARFSNPKVRRWNQQQNEDITLLEGAVPVLEATATQPHWIDLEDGVQVQFVSDGHYRSGDYWLIPARVATGGIDWPKNPDGTLTKPPRGVQHYYAPLGLVSRSKAGELELSDCRCRLLPTNLCQRAALVNRADRTVLAAGDNLEAVDRDGVERKRTTRRSTGSVKP